MGVLKGAVYRIKIGTENTALATLQKKAYKAELDSMC